MFKFRTVRHGTKGPVITSTRDSRIFIFGSILRMLKIDEISQLINILKGDMSFVGPAEDPSVVSNHYLTDTKHS